RVDHGEGRSLRLRHIHGLSPLWSRGSAFSLCVSACLGLYPSFCPGNYHNFEFPRTTMDAARARRLVELLFLSHCRTSTNLAHVDEIRPTCVKRGPSLICLFFQL